MHVWVHSIKKVSTSVSPRMGPALNMSKLSNKAQDKEDEIKQKLYEDNKRWNDWRLKLHWRNLEWVNPRNLTKSNKPFSFSSKKDYLNKNDRTSHWVIN